MILIPWAASAEQVRQREHDLRTVAERRRRTDPRRWERARHDHRARLTMSAGRHPRGRQPQPGTGKLRHRVHERLARMRPGSV